VIATAGMPDSEAGQLLSPRLKANRRLMRYVNLWVTDDEAMLEIKLSGRNPLFDALLSKKEPVDSRSRTGGKKFPAGPRHLGIYNYHQQFDKRSQRRKRNFLVEPATHTIIIMPGNMANHLSRV